MTDKEKEEKIKNLMACGLSEREARSYLADEEKLQPEPEDGPQLEEEEKPFDPATSRAAIAAEVEEELIEERLKERKLAILDKIEESLLKSEEDDKADSELREKQREITETQLALTRTWSDILQNSSWSALLYRYFEIVHGLTKGMAAKAVITVTESNGQMHFTYEFFDKKGQLVETEFNDVYGEE